MNIFSSGWLQRMVDKAGKTPVSRVQSLFQVLQDWIAAPGMRQQLQEALPDELGQRALKTYLRQLVEASGVVHPDMVSAQLHMLLLGALNEEIRRPDSRALAHAGQAAMLLVTAQMPDRRVVRGGVAIAASVMLVAGVAAMLLPRYQPEPLAAPAIPMVAMAAVPSPDQVAALYHLHEKLRLADCTYPQALMLAPEQREPFIENVVNGDVGKLRPEAIVMVNQLYQKVTCNYAPAAMQL